MAILLGMVGCCPPVVLPPLPPERPAMVGQPKPLPSFPSPAWCEKHVPKDGRPAWQLSNEYGYLCPEEVLKVIATKPIPPSLPVPIPPPPREVSLPVPFYPAEERNSVVLRIEKEEPSLPLFSSPSPTPSTSTSTSSVGRVYVRPYTRKDGTKVRGHSRKKGR